MSRAMYFGAWFFLLAVGSGLAIELFEDCDVNSYDDFRCPNVTRFPVVPANYNFFITRMSVSPSAEVRSLEVPPRSRVFPFREISIEGKTAARNQRLTVHPDSFAGVSATFSDMELYFAREEEFSEGFVVDDPYLRSLTIKDLQVDELPKDFLHNVKKLQLINTGLGDVVAAVDGAAGVDRSAAAVQLNRTALAVLILSDSGDGLVKLPNGSFPSLGPHLRELALARNKQFTTVESGAFRHMRRLRDLDLSETALRDLPEDVFAPLYRLETLNLRGNALRRLSPRAVAPLRNLRRLDLADNELSALPRHVFRLSVNLLNVDLRRNRLTVFASDLFDATKAIGEGSRLYPTVHVEGNPLDCRLLENLADRQIVDHGEVADGECLIHDDFLEVAYPDIFGEPENCRT